MSTAVSTEDVDEDDLPNRFGGKSLGFLAVPSAWRPAALLVDKDLFVAYRDGGAFETLSEEVWRDLQAFGEGHGPNLIVRSSATNETIKERGRYQSIEVNANITLVEFRQVLGNIFEDYVKSSGTDAMCLIIQKYVTGVEIGFLSNEHRLVDKPYRWIVERTRAPASESVELTSISAKQATVVATDEPLVCLTRQEMLSRLRSVARYFWKVNSSQRLLVEWCWDGAKLWIVQRDVDILSAEGRTPNSIINAFPPPPLGDAGKVFHRYEIGVSTPWSKLRNIADFTTDGRVPPHRLFYASADRVAAALGTPQSRRELADEIDLLTAGRAVLRTDALKPTQNLGRTNTVNGAAAVEWLRAQTTSWYSSGTALTDVVFILHRYISARAAAWSHYKQGSAVVRIDALWGLADGMQYYPTDTYICRATDGRQLSETIRLRSWCCLNSLTVRG